MPKQVYYKISSDRQMKLLKSCLKEFIRKPYDKITVASLTDTMKILRTDFYYYFSDKDDIFSAILDEFYNIAKANNENPNFQDALVALFEKIVNVEGVRNKAFIAELTEVYHPQFAKDLVPKVRKLFNCTCEGDKPQVKIMTKIYRFMTVVNLYEKGELSLNSAREIINN